MQIIRWTGGGFGMACHNYDGDMLTDEVAQVHRSPGFITSNLVGKSEDGSLIKEFEASHGTVADLWHMHLRGEETSMNPLGMVVALLGAMDHAAALNPESQAEVTKRLGRPSEREPLSQACEPVEVHVELPGGSVRGLPHGQRHQGPHGPPGPHHREVRGVGGREFEGAHGQGGPCGGLYGRGGEDDAGTLQEAPEEVPGRDTDHIDHKDSYYYILRIGIVYIYYDVYDMYGIDGLYSRLCYFNG